MRILNGKEPKRLKLKKVAVEPEQWEVRVRGKRLVVDAHSLLAAEITGDSYPAPADSAYSFEPSGNAQTRSLVFNLTHDCNLRCTYCFVRNYNPDHEFPTLRMETIKQAIKLIPYNPHARFNPQFTINFFGGEPLLAWDRLKSAVAHAEMVAAQHGVKALFHVTTNGTLLTQEIVDFLDEHCFSLIVSLDGPAKVHDKYRPLPEGSSHAATMAGLELLKGKKNIRGITLRSTFTGEGVDLVGRLEYLNDLCDKGYANSVSVEPASLTEQGCAALPDGHDQAITLRNIKQFLPEYEKAADWFCARIKAGKRARFFHFYKLMQRIYDRQTSPSECGAGMGYKTVGPTGDVFACHREGGSRIGNIWTGIDEVKRAKWVDNRFYARTKCPTCRVRFICGGGCRMCSMDMNGNTRDPDVLGCWFKKVWIKWCLWLLSEFNEDEVKLALGRPSGKGCNCR